jgi:hypothetical protein
MQTTDLSTTRLKHYIASVLPWLHGHQLKAVTDYTRAILREQTGNQAALARTAGNQEASLKRLSRLLHNERVCPRKLADGILEQAVRCLPKHGRVRVAIDWTIEDDQHLCVVSLVIEGRAIPIFWRAYRQDRLKGRTHRYERAVIGRVLRRLKRAVGQRLVVTADRGFADIPLYDLLNEMDVAFVIRVKCSTKVLVRGKWRKLKTFGFRGNTRRRSLGRLSFCEKRPRRLWITTHRARNKQGAWGIWHLVSNRGWPPPLVEAEYARRFGCEQGFRDAKWWLGFAKARIKDIRAWSRLFALFALTLLILNTLASRLIAPGDQRAHELLRRVVSRRSSRIELSPVAVITALIKQLPDLLEHLSPLFRLELERVF